MISLFIKNKNTKEETTGPWSRASVGGSDPYHRRSVQIHFIWNSFFRWGFTQQPWTKHPVIITLFSVIWLLWRRTAFMWNEGSGVSVELDPELVKEKLIGSGISFYTWIQTLNSFIHIQFGFFFTDFYSDRHTASELPVQVGPISSSGPWCRVCVRLPGDRSASPWTKTTTTTTTQTPRRRGRRRRRPDHGGQTELVFLSQLRSNCSSLNIKKLAARHRRVRRHVFIY